MLVTPISMIPISFAILIHCINPAARMLIGSQAHTLVRGDSQTINPEDGDQSINLFNHPEDIDKRVSLSCSLIDQDHHGTWGNAGLIVESPTENVCVTSSGDMGASGLNKASLIGEARRNPILTAKQLLDQTHPGSYNEVVVLASNGENQVRLAGFFYKVAEDGEPMNESLAQTMKSHAAWLHLPVIAVTEPNLYAGNKITREDNKLSVQFNGKLYWLKAKDNRFYGIDQKYNAEFIDPETMVNVLSYLQENGLDDLEIEQIRKEYFLADKERQKPRVDFDKQGEVDGIKKRSGYGKTEKRMTIAKIGYAHWAYLSQEKEQISKMMASGVMGVINSILMLSPQGVEDIVQEAIDNASSDEEKSKIRAWYESIKENVVKYWQTQNRNQSGPKSFDSKIFLGRAKLDFDLTKLPKGLFNNFGGESVQHDKSQEDKGKS